MMAHAVPLIVTDIDGLNEIFEDGHNCLMVKPIINNENSLVVEELLLEQKIINLLENAALRKQIGRMGRNTIEKKSI